MKTPTKHGKPTSAARNRGNDARTVLRQVERLLAPCRQCPFANCVRPCLEYQA